MPTPTTPTWVSPANGATVDASVTLQWTAGTVTPPSDTTVDDFVALVNTKRAALSLSAMGSTQQTAWGEFWARLGNRDSELSGDLQSALADAFCLRSAYNVGGGNEVVGLRGTILTRSGSTLPAWGTAGITFAGGTGILAASAGIISNAAAASLYGYAIATGTNATSQYLVAQWPTVRVAGSFATVRGTTPASSAQTIFGDDADALQAAVSGASYWTTRASLLSTLDTDASQGALVTLPGGTVITTSGAALTTPVIDEPFRIGNSVNLDRGWVGEISVVLAFDADLRADAVALDTIVRETIGAGL